MSVSQPPPPPKAPPPPPGWAQHPQAPHPQPVMYSQPTNSVGFGMQTHGGMLEVCPSCRQTVMMTQHREPTTTAYMWSCLACFFLGGAVVGILICFWLLMYSDCVDITFRCPNCGFVARQIQGQ